MRRLVLLGSDVTCEDGLDRLRDVGGEEGGWVAISGEEGWVRPRERMEVDEHAGNDAVVEPVREHDMKALRDMLDARRVHRLQVGQQGSISR